MRADKDGEEGKCCKKDFRKPRAFAAMKAPTILGEGPKHPALGKKERKPREGEGGLMGTP